MNQESLIEYATFLLYKQGYKWYVSILGLRFVHETTLTMEYIHIPTPMINYHDNIDMLMALWTYREVIVVWL